MARPHKSTRNDYGFTLIEMIVGMALTGLVMLALMTMLKDSAFMLGSVSQREALGFARTRVMQELNRPLSWINTYSNGTNFLVFRCLTASPQTAASNCTQGPFVIYDSNNVPFYDGRASSTDGFDKFGIRCTTYPSKSCFIRLDLSWRFAETYNAYLPTAGDFYFPRGPMWTRGATADFKTYFPTIGTISQAGVVSGYFNVAPATIIVSGYFTVNSAYAGATYTQALSNVRHYNFELTKEVP